MNIYIALIVEGFQEAEYIREEYDHLFEKVPLHLTLVFPTNVSVIDSKALDDIAKSEKPIEAIVTGPTGSPENLLFLTLEKGNDPVIGLHKRLYSTMFRDAFDPTYTYFPHLTVARLNNRENMIDTLNSLRCLEAKHILLSKLAVIEICPDGQRKNIFELELGQGFA